MRFTISHYETLKDFETSSPTIMISYVQILEGYRKIHIATHILKTKTNKYLVSKLKKNVIQFN